MENFYARFFLFSAFDILFLYISCWMLKHLVHKFPEQLIPLYSVTMSILLALIWIDVENITPGYYYLFEIGIMHGFGVIGINQLYKQTIKYIKYRKGLKILKEIKKSKRVS